MKKFTVWIKKHKKTAVFLCIAIIIAAAVLTIRHKAQAATHSTAGYTMATVISAPGVDSTTFASRVERYLNAYYRTNRDFKVSAFSMESILIALGFSMTIGAFFGYYPANKAAKMDPINALRYE